LATPAAASKPEGRDGLRDEDEARDGWGDREGVRNGDRDALSAASGSSAAARVGGVENRMRDVCVSGGGGGTATGASGQRASDAAPGSVPYPLCMGLCVLSPKF
jgi:hypothetical protein